MSVVETWYCDWHEPETSDDFINADEARDTGWKKVHRFEDRPSLIEGGTRWTHLTEQHVCPGCQRQPNVQADLDEDGWVDEDEQPKKVSL